MLNEHDIRDFKNEQTSGGNSLGPNLGILPDGICGESTYKMAGIYIPVPVGYWRIGATDNGLFGTQFPIYMRPTDEQIRNTEMTFGWKFIEPNIPIV